MKTLAFLLLLTMATASVAVDTLVIGDSYAQLGSTYWATYCGNTVSNQGASGTTSVEWAAGTTMVDALNTAPGATKILYVIGGNDFINSGCTLTQAEVAAVVTQSLQIAVSNKGANQQIVMLGYPMPTATVATSGGECPGVSASALLNLNRGIADACAALGVTYIDMTGVAGATLSPPGFSPLETEAGSLHADQIHLNEAGYCTLVQTNSYRAEFGCTVAQTTCSASPTAPGPSPSPVFQPTSGAVRPGQNIIVCIVVSIIAASLIFFQ